MDIQKLISDVLAKLKGDDKLVDRFMKEPVKVLESLLNIDLPDDQINAVIEGVKAKLKLDGAAENVKGVLDAVSGLAGMFGKK